MASSLNRSNCYAHLALILLITTAAFSTIFLDGCGSVNNTPTVPPSPTNVVVLMTNTANNKLVKFGVTIASIILTDQAGNSVPLYNNPNAFNPNVFEGPAEFMHLDGTVELLVITGVPQGIYPAATVKVSGCGLTYVFVDLTGIENNDSYSEGLCAQGTGNTTVNLPSPIKITGPFMGLSLNLQLPQSYTQSGVGNSATYTISPVFTLSPIAISSQPTNEANGKIMGMDAQITSITTEGNSFVAQTPDSISLNINSGNNTVYQGIAGFSTLAVGTFVNLDVAIQPDTSLLATRVEVDNLVAPTVASGPILIGPDPWPGEFTIQQVEGQQGCNIGAVPYCDSVFQFDSNTVFSVSGQLSNLQSLPFTPAFSAATMFLGQNVSVFTPGVPNPQSLETATTITLMPQTINGMVTAASTENSFSVYAVALPPYDLIPNLQGFTNGPLAHLNDPATVFVYVDANTQLLNSTALNPGALLRFRGLVFDDNGTVRMDCNQINDGVAE